MPRFEELKAANERFVAAGGPEPTKDGKPTRHLAVVTCMDARIDVFAVLGLHVGEAIVVRNAGARITEDVLRSLALAVHALGVDEVVVMQHTKCGLTGVTDEELQQLTGAEVGFLTIHDHAEALERDLDVLWGTAYLADLPHAIGSVYDVATGQVEVLARRDR